MPFLWAHFVFSIKRNVHAENSFDADEDKGIFVPRITLQRSQSHPSTQNEYEHRNIYILVMETLHAMLKYELLTFVRNKMKCCAVCSVHKISIWYWQASQHKLVWRDECKNGKSVVEILYGIHYYLSFCVDVVVVIFVCLSIIIHPTVHSFHSIQSVCVWTCISEKIIFVFLGYHCLWPTWTY